MSLQFFLSPRIVFWFSQLDIFFAARIISIYHLCSEFQILSILFVGHASLNFVFCVFNWITTTWLSTRISTCVSARRNLFSLLYDFITICQWSVALCIICLCCAGVFTRDTIVSRIAIAIAIAFVSDVFEKPNHYSFKLFSSLIPVSVSVISSSENVLSLKLTTFSCSYRSFCKE